MVFIDMMILIMKITTMHTTMFVIMLHRMVSVNNKKVI